MWGDPNKKLIIGAEKGKLDLVKQCLDAGADINAVRHRMTALQYACWHAHPDCVKLLLERNANVHYADDYNRTALHWACIGGNVDITRMILERDVASLNVKDSGGNTPLILSAKDRSGAIAAMLLELGADIYPKNNDGDDAREQAIRHENGHMRELLNQVEAQNSRQWKRDGENSMKREQRLDNGMLLREYLDFSEKMYMSILSGDKGQLSHSRHSFNQVSRVMITDATNAMRQLEPPRALKALPKPSTDL